VELKEIKSIIDLMTKNGLTEFELEKDNVKIRIKRGPQGIGHSISQELIEGASLGTSPAPAMGAAVTAVAPVVLAADSKEIKSPMVGTFYRSPSPESAAYIEIGQSVTEETVVCIIEAMKVMNEVKAGVSGTIAEICTQNAHPVEFGAKMFRIV
jgi:acetyl-CoA carboxylase biotin carboxyl carrier protein